MPVKPLTILCFVYVKHSSTLLIFLFYLTLTRIFTSLMPLSHPALLSRFELLSLSLSATEGNKILLLWKPLTGRQEAAYESSSVETEAYIRPFPVCALRGGFSVYEHCVSLSCVRNTDGVTGRARKRLRNRESDMKGMKERWLILIRQKMSCYC